MAANPIDPGQQAQALSKQALGAVNSAPQGQSMSPQGIPLPAAGGASSLPSGIMNPFGPDGYKFREASAASRSVNAATDTASGQLKTILDDDGPLVQRARALANAQAADSGLKSSSIAVGNAYGAMIDRAAPIAQADAQAYNEAANLNAQLANSANIANANAYNSLGGIMLNNQFESVRLQAQQGFTAAQAALDRAQQTAMADKSVEAQQGLQKAQQDFAAAQSALDRANQAELQKGQQNYGAGQAALDRENQQQLADKNIKADQDRILKQHELTLAQMGFSDNLQKANLPAVYSANIAQQTMANLQAINMDPNLTPENKRIAIQNAMAVQNAAIDLGKKLYGDSVKGLEVGQSGQYVTAPGGIMGPPSPAPAPAPASQNTGFFSGVYNQALAFQNRNPNV